MNSLTHQEYQALLSILQRAPLLPAEVVGMQVILAKIQPPTQPQPTPSEALQP